MGIDNGELEARPGDPTPFEFGELGEMPESEGPEDDEPLDPSVGKASSVVFPLPVDSLQNDSSSSRFDIDKHVRLALQSQSVAVPKQLWESGVWNSIFSDSPGLDSDIAPAQVMHRPTLPQGPATFDGTAESSKKKPRVQKSFDQVVKFKPDMSWKEQTDAALQSSIKLWYQLIGRWRCECALYIELHVFRWESDALTMLLDIFASRSSYTLRKRALALMHICDYLDANYKEAFPIRESDMYTFLCTERESGAPASRLKGYMQAVTFCRFVLDVSNLESVINSARCKGTTKPRSVVEKNQASRLKVEEVRLFHATLEGDGEIWHKMFCGAALFCLYARSRWGDLMRAEKILVDRDSMGVACYLEARVGSHKTMQAQQHRHQFLPMVATSKGLVESNWIEVWLEIRKMLSLDFSIHGVMPAPLPDGQPSSRPSDSQEAAGWLRLILFGEGAPVEGRKVASHSLKTTTLSFAAKRGLDINLRMQLGYHTQPYRMGLTYSRDGAAASLAALEQLLCEIKLGLFLPDETRIGRIISQSTMTCVSRGPILIKDEDVSAPTEPQVENSAPAVSLVGIAAQTDGLEGSSSSESSSTSGSEMEETSFQPQEEPSRFSPPSAPEGFNMWQHRKSRIIHLMDLGHKVTFVCGRGAGAFHTKDNLNPRYDTPICWSCFNKARQ